MIKKLSFLLFITFIFSEICLAGNNKDNCCRIAYIDMNILMQEYTRVSDLNEEMRKKENDDNTIIDKKKKIFDESIKEFQKKLENNLYSSQSAIEDEHKRLLNTESELGQLAVKMQTDRETKSQYNKHYIENLIKEAATKYNQTANFQFIFNKEGIDNIIVANTEYDITKHILEILNTEYAIEKEKTNNH